MNSWRMCNGQVVQRTFNDLGLLALRVWVSQEFLQAGINKLATPSRAPGWFQELLFPFPLHMLGADLNWLAAGLGETVLSVLLLLGWKSRFAACGLIYITWVAVYTVHFDLGWGGWNQIDSEAGQGFKVPLMLGLMLFALVTQGPGRYSVQGLCNRSDKPQASNT